MHLLGVYDYTVILTYVGLLSTVVGITQALHGDYKAAVFCLALSGICDAFDGRIARTKKNRTKREKSWVNHFFYVVRGKKPCPEIE